MKTTYTLAELGWSADFMQQMEADEVGVLAPARIASLHRSRIDAIGQAGPVSLFPDPKLSIGEMAVGDWLLTRGVEAVRLLERRTLLSRRAAGTGAQRQLIAANVDTLFIVSSCNADFNPARLERYLALAASSGATPVILLTKADLCDNAADYVAQAQALQRDLVVLALDARGGDPAAELGDWCKAGQTVALLGSSGVGKSTLSNALGGTVQAVGEIREDDAKGRHTTTSRQLIELAGGGWLIDTPGVRELQLTDAAEGIDVVFSDITDLAAQCRFTDCAHEVEPGCAVQAAIAAGTLDPERLPRWQKLLREDRHNSETLADARSRGKEFGKSVKSAIRAKKLRRSEES